MKKHGVALLILTMLALTGLANAQGVIKAQVPFEFVANGKTMPAGDVRIDVQSSAGPNVLWINAGDQHMVSLTREEVGSGANEATSLVFHNYGGRYFLAGVKLEGRSTAYTLPAGKVEMELRAQGAKESDVTISPSAE